MAERDDVMVELLKTYNTDIVKSIKLAANE